MIITRLKGGLGNQLFQSAAGLRLARARNTKLLVDRSLLESSAFRTARSYEMDAFRFSAEMACPKDVKTLAPPVLSRIRRRITRLSGSNSGFPEKERHFHFDPDVLSLPDGVCLDGYWQSEFYFADSVDRVRKEFTFKKSPVGKNVEIIAEMASCNAVSLHVRRGDYVTDPGANAIHGVCSVDYYYRAIDYISERVPNPVYFLFSDDPEWVRENLELRGPASVIDHNGLEAGCEDLRLMSQCKHHIIANSSFSWWGAWLNSNPNKIVVAPEGWFADGPRDTSDLIRASWVKL
jgi:hypothetical protein